MCVTYLKNFILENSEFLLLFLWVYILNENDSGFKQLFDIQLKNMFNYAFRLNYLYTRFILSFFYDFFQFGKNCSSHFSSKSLCFFMWKTPFLDQPHLILRSPIHRLYIIQIEHCSFLKPYISIVYFQSLYFCTFHSNSK